MHKILRLLLTAATDHFFNPNTPGLTNIVQKPGVHVALPDGTTTQANGTATLSKPELNAECQKIHLFDQFPKSLLSVPKLCDHTYAALFTKDKVNIYKATPTINQTPLIQAPRNKNTCLRELQFPQHQHTVNYVHKIVQ